VCVGSSCHVRGSRRLLERFAEIVRTGGLGTEVTLVGSFCMERCGERMNWKLDGQEMASTTVSDAEETLRCRLEEK
jgi:NADH:ubiquinone oxidoreductase subunit E